MDTWKYFDITHREHLILNPLSSAKLDFLVSLLPMSAGDAVVDIGSGKGEFLFRLVEAWGVRAEGVDLSPPFVEAAEARLAERLPQGGVVFHRMDGKDYAPDEPASLRMASCLGASWIWGGYDGTLAALSAMVAPGGWVVSGEPYWRREPEPAYLEAIGHAREDFGTHLENGMAGARHGLELVYALDSGLDDWDRYEGLQWHATAEYALRHPEDPDLPELRARVAKERASYLRWGRDALGWAVYVFRREGGAGE